MVQKLCIELRKKNKITKQKINTILYLYYKMTHLVRGDIIIHHITKKSQKYYQIHLNKNKTNSYRNTTKYKINKYQHLFKLIIPFKTITQAKRKMPIYTFYNKKALLQCGDIECNHGPRINLLVNHPQIHHERQKTCFFNKTTQIKPEYNHIFELFKPYLNYPSTINTNQHLIQFCINNNQCPQSYLFYAILITLAPTLTQSNQLIANNSTQWTTYLIKNLIECPNPKSTNLHKLQKFYLENPHIITPLSSIQNKLYSFITIERPNITTLQQKFPYLPEKMINEALKCLQPIPNFTHPNPIQYYPPINPHHTPHTNPDTKMISWNYGTLNTTLLGLQSLINKPTPPSIIAIQETKLTASKSTIYLQRLFPQYKMIFNNTNTPTQTQRTQGQPYNNPVEGY
jgi:hypothetical protein